MLRHPIHSLLLHKVRGRNGDPVTLRLRLAEEICALKGHREAIDNDGYAYCNRCWDTITDRDKESNA